MAIVVALLAVVAAILFWTGAPPTSPVVQGEPLDFWVRELIAGTKERHARAKDVIVAESAAHVDWLVKILNRQPSLTGRLLLRIDDGLPRRLSVRLHRRLRPHEIALDRAGAARALGLAGESSPQVIESLGVALPSSDHRLANEAALALGRLGPAGGERLLNLLPVLPPGPRLFALSAIGPENTTAAAAVPVILGEARRDENSRISSLYGHVLAKFGRDAVRPSYAAARDLEPAAAGRLFEVFVSAVHADFDFLRAWDEQGTTQDVGVRLFALRVLARSGSHGSYRAVGFARAVVDPDPEVRHAGLQGLVSVRESARRAVPALVAGLETDSAEIQLAAIRALGQLGPVALEAKPVLEDLAAGNDANLRQAAVEALTLIEASLPD